MDDPTPEQVDAAAATIHDWLTRWPAAVEAMRTLALGGDKDGLTNLANSLAGKDIGIAYLVDATALARKAQALKARHEPKQTSPRGRPRRANAA